MSPLVTTWRLRLRLPRRHKYKVTLARRTDAGEVPTSNRQHRE